MPESTGVVRAQAPYIMHAEDVFPQGSKPLVTRAPGRWERDPLPSLQGQAKVAAHLRELIPSLLLLVVLRTDLKGACGQPRNSHLTSDSTANPPAISHQPHPHEDASGHPEGHCTPLCPCQ
jgi:hypothetical protein